MKRINNKKFSVLSTYDLDNNIAVDVKMSNKEVSTLLALSFIGAGFVLYHGCKIGTKLFRFNK